MTKQNKFSIFHYYFKIIEAQISMLVVGNQHYICVIINKLSVFVFAFRFGEFFK